jgi:hypothetical protein
MKLKLWRSPIAMQLVGKNETAAREKSAKHIARERDSFLSTCTELRVINVCSLVAKENLEEKLAVIGLLVRKLRLASQFF